MNDGESGMDNIVVFLEFREDAAYFTEHVAHELEDESFRIIVLDDAAAIYLKTKGIPFIHVEELLPPSSEGALCEDIWRHLESFCEYVDEALTDRFDFLEKGAPYVAAQIELLKVVFDALILKIEVLRNAFEQIRPRKIYFARNDLVQPRHHRLYFDESFSLYSVLLETRLAETAGYLPEAVTWESRYDIGGAAGQYSHYSKWWYRAARALKHIGSSLRQPSIGTDASRPRVCVIGGGERSLQTVMEKFSEEGAALTAWRPQTALAPSPVGSFRARSWRVAVNIAVYRRYRSCLEQAWRSLTNSPEFLSRLCWKGVDFSHIVVARIMHAAITANVAHQQVSMNEARILLQNVDILLSSYYSAFERPIAYLARRSGKKVISVQHGAMGHDAGGYGWGHAGNPTRASNKSFFYTDMAEVDIKLAWGDGAAREMSGWRFKDRHPRLAVIGASHLKHLQGRRSASVSERKRILFVSNAFGNNTYLLMNFRGLGYRYRQYRILHALASHPADHEIIYKAYPYWIRNDAYSLVRSKFPDKRMAYVDGDKRLPELFKEVDCVVMDIPTTGFYEACITGLPVFLFNVSCEFSDPVLKMLGQRVYYSEDLEKFCSMLDAFQDRPVDFPALNDDTFMKAFLDVDRKPDLIALIFGNEDISLASAVGNS